MEAGHPAASVSYQHVTQAVSGTGRSRHPRPLTRRRGRRRSACWSVRRAAARRRRCAWSTERSSITEGDILIGETSVRDRDPADLRREIGYVIQQIGLFPHRTVAREHRDGAAAARLGPRPGTGERADELLDLIGLDPELARSLPQPALRRPAAAGRRRPGAGRRPAGDADGRALRRDRPDQARAPPERVPAPAGRDPEDRPLRHPRHRRGDQDGRPDRDPEEGRAARPVRHAGRAADGPGGRLRRGLRRRRPGAETARPDEGAGHRPLAGAPGLRRPGDGRGHGPSSRARRSPMPCSSTPSAGRSAGSRTPTCKPRPCRRRPTAGRSRSSISTT